MARQFSFLSESSAPLCHWGLLVTELDISETKSQWEQFNENREDYALPPWGTLIELQRSPDYKNNYNMKTNFSLHEWYREWRYLSCTYAGETEATDKDLSEEGKGQDSIYVYIGTIC